MTYNSEPEIALQQALRAHFKTKYGSLDRAADLLGWSQPTLSAILRGDAWPAENILADAGIEVTVTVVRTVEWRKK